MMIGELDGIRAVERWSALAMADILESRGEGYYCLSIPSDAWKAAEG
jgi:hypothetical protein